ncbi:MAG: ribosome maturation factor [Saprospiraceae bacterium]|nr:ribosome maturation factor [Saprospiraceae bacterium]
MFPFLFPKTTAYGYRKHRKSVVGEIPGRKLYGLFLVDIERSAKKIAVFVDSDSGMTFQKCQQLSRYLEGIFDEKNWFGDDYILELSSPGITRPLRFARQYVKNIGRWISVETTDGSMYKGMLSDADEEKITVKWEEIKKEGKKKIKEEKVLILEYNQIKEAKIQIKI